MRPQLPPEVAAGDFIYLIYFAKNITSDPD